MIKMINREEEYNLRIKLLVLVWAALVGSWLL